MSIILYRGITRPPHHSWAVVGGQIIKTLDKLGYAVRLESTSETSDLDPDLKHLLHTPGDANIGLTYTIPPNLEYLKTAKKLLIYNYETTILPLGWAKIINQHADVVLPASEFIKKIFIANGILPEKVHVFPHGINLEIFKPDHSQRSDNKFRFLNVSSPHARKGLEILIRAFSEEFASTEPVALDIKVGAIESTGQHYYVNPKRVLESVKDSFATPEINIISKKHDDEELVKLYNSCHAYVSPSRSEGFGLTYLEAAACNLPIIATGYGGHLDFLNQDNAFLIGYKMIAAPRKCQYWHFHRKSQIADPDIEQLKKVMRYVVTNYEVAQKKATLAQEMVQKYTWENVALRLLEIIDKQKWGPKFSISRKDAIVNIPLDFKTIEKSGIVNATDDRDFKKAIKQKERQLSLIMENKQRIEQKEQTVRRQLEELKQQEIAVEERRRVRKISGKTNVNLVSTVKLVDNFTMSSFSVIFNEEKQIERMLRNIYKHFDEIIIVDGGSTDDTLGIIDRFKKEREDDKIKVFNYPQQVSRYSKKWDQAGARNFALSKCTKRWIFMIDADEMLDRGFRKKIHRIISERSENWYAFPKHHYWLSTRQIRIDRYWYPNYSYRLWKNGLNIQYESKSRHCQPIASDMLNVLNTATLMNNGIFTDIPIHHFKHMKIEPVDGLYRANDRDVKTLRELNKGLRLKHVEPFDDSVRMLYFMENFKRYSGGRYHLWGLATTMARIGLKVKVVSNMDSIYKADFKVPPNLQLEISPNYIVQSKEFVDVVVATHNYCGPVALNQAQAHGAKLIAVIIDLPNLVRETRGGKDSTEEYWRDFKAILPKADLVFVSANLARKKLLEWCPEVKSDNIMVVPPPINSERIDVTSRAAEQHEIVIIGRFDVEHKCFEDMLKALSMMKVKPLPVINVIGAGRPQYYQRLASKLGLSLVFHFNISDKQKFELISRCKLGASASVYEGFGMPPAEFMLSGKAYVAYDLPITKDVYGDNIVYAKLGDVKDLARQIDFVLRDDSFRRKMIEKGRHFALDNFTYRHSMEKAKQAIRKLGLM